MSVESAAQELPMAPLVAVHRDGGKVVALALLEGFDNLP